MQERITITALARSTWCRSLVRLLAILLALGEPMRAALAAAAPADAGSMAMASTVEQNPVVTLPSPPPLLNLDQALYAASPAQVASLRNLENQAVKDVISLHGLTTGDTSAIQTWGRYDALLHLYTLLLKAIDTDASERTQDQQNAVDWVSGILQRQAIAAAQSAGREYVKWAGLNVHGYDTLLNSNPTVSQLADFLNDNPQPSGGWCDYRSPAPNSSEYTGYNDQSCLSAGLSCRLSVFGCPPPTPSYDQFVKWGQLVASYDFLSSAQFAETAHNMAAAAGIAVAAVAASLAIAVIPSALVGTLVAVEGVTIAGLGGLVSGAGSIGIAILPYATVATTGPLLLAVAGSIAVVVLATYIAVSQAYIVITAAKLPGQLAELINGAQTTPPNPKAVRDSTGGDAALFTLFVGATMPAPINDTCDNSGTPRGITILAGIVTVVGGPTCLNPSAIPEASPDDLQFLVQQNGDTTQRLSPTIAYKNAETGLATTARLSKTWFVTEANGSKAQSLRISYVDWDGRAQNAWVLGNPTDGYAFLGYAVQDTSEAVDTQTCIAAKKCLAGDAIKYLGADGNFYSAGVRGHRAPVGTPKISAAIEGSPVSFDANGVAPEGGTSPISYQWRFQKDGCGYFPCGSFALENSQAVYHPDYGDPVAGLALSHTWKQSGPFYVELKAVDATGVTATKTVKVPVENVPPTLNVLPDCPPPPSAPILCLPRTGETGSPMRVSGAFDDIGDLSNLTVMVFWGDGETSYNWNQIGPNVTSIGTMPVSSVTSPQGNYYSFDTTHTYGGAGTYYGTVTVSDGSAGATFVGLAGVASETFVMTIHGLAQSINFPALPGLTYRDAPIAISATGGNSGMPVTFAVTGAGSVCTISSAGGAAVVTPGNAGTCSITASQSGNNQYDPAAAVTQSFMIQPAPLAIKPSSPGVIYNGTVPKITPIYASFVNGDSIASLAKEATCSSTAPSDGSAGIYNSSCTGAVAPNYRFTYESGTLTISKAPTTLTLGSPLTSAVKGQPVTFTAPVGLTTQGGGLRTGTVAFKDGATTIAGCAAQPVDTTTETATCTTAALSVGTHSVNAAYSGDNNHLDSVSNGAVTLTVKKASTSTTLSASPTPSINATPVNFAAAVAVTAPGAGAPTGTATFFDGATRLGTGPLSVLAGKVQAAFNTSTLPLGRHSITVSYGGDGDFTTSTSAAVIHYVNTDLSAFPRLPGGAFNLTGANLKGAVLFSVSFAGASLANSNFMEANFTNAILANADMRGSNFKDTNFTGANLTGANLTNSNLKGALGLQTATLTNVVWSQTTCPNGKISDQVGGTCVGQW